MHLKNLILKDVVEDVPFEEILRLIREGKLKEATIKWRGCADPNNPHHYTLSGEVSDEVFTLGLGLKKP